MQPFDSQRRWRTASFIILVLTVAQLVAAAFLGLDQFAAKAFGARLIGYPMMMLALPVGWALVARLRGVASPIPWGATALIMWGFFFDVTGNTLNLYDTLEWWDDANHFLNWVTLSLGVGLCLARGAGAQAPRWLLAIATAGAGAMLAIAWELAEWYTFIRHGTELDTAYQDTLGDEAAGTLGGITAGLILVWILGRRRAAKSVS